MRHRSFILVVPPYVGLPWPRLQRDVDGPGWLVMAMSLQRRWNALARGLQREAIASPPVSREASLSWVSAIHGVVGRVLATASIAGQTTADCLAVARLIAARCGVNVIQLTAA
jgi:hypothetical protein